MDDNEIEKRKVGMSGVFTTLNDHPIKWDDKSVIHACEGADVHPGIRLIWTLCERDVPANAAHVGGDSVITCLKCLKEGTRI